jgi:hypothetical protein
LETQAVVLFDLFSEGLTNEQRLALEADVGEFQIAEKVDGKITKRYESHEKPLENKVSFAYPLI